ncbi:MAG: Crossover junction endodeoxyribonuclease RuvC [Labilithrix sp.]|nr:Crossover junction endodeoxyribonuclease RuvC [Labilithrix sp.]
MTSQGITVLGLDPGTRHFGWGVVCRVGTRMTHVAHGVVSVEGKGPLGERLVAIESALVDVLAKFVPLEVSIESMFYAKDASSSSKLAHARGVGLLVASRAGLAVFEYPPARVKQTVVGSGRADKAQVAHMIRVMLGLAATPPADAADALAIAVTHLQGRALPGTRAPISRAGVDR